MRINIAPANDCSQEWIATRLHLRIIVVTGVVHPGVEPTSVYCPLESHGNAPEEKPRDVWLYHHSITDAAGHKATHFTLISQVGYTHKNYNPPVSHCPKYVLYF